MIKRLPDIGWCNVPAGEFVMDEGKSQHTLNLPYSYQIAKYPVTNSQYALFVEAGGYSEAGRSFWTKAGWAERLERSDKKRTERFNLTLKPWTEPRFWKNRLYNLANQPVVGMSWYEAVAYCNWLTEQLREIGEERFIRLPTEAEWEKAARGPDGRKYPWGNEPPTPEHANYVDTDIGSPCAVGLFPRSASPYGVEGMAGNVWEWCATKYGKNYPYKLENEWSEEYLAGNRSRRLRGGAFYDVADFLRAACRDHWDPDLNHDSQGFRLISSPFGSGILPS